VAVTLASTMGFWSFVTSHVKPLRAPLHPKVAQPQAAQDDSSANQWTMIDSGPSAAQAAAAAGQPAVVRTVVVQQATAQSQVQGQAALGAKWVANQTGAKPVTYTSVS